MLHLELRYAMGCVCQVVLKGEISFRVLQGQWLAWRHIAGWCNIYPGMKVFFHFVEMSSGLAGDLIFHFFCFTSLCWVLPSPVSLGARWSPRVQQHWRGLGSSTGRGQQMALSGTACLPASPPPPTVFPIGSMESYEVTSIYWCALKYLNVNMHISTEWLHGPLSDNIKLGQEILWP